MNHKDDDNKKIDDPNQISMAFWKQQVDDGRRITAASQSEGQSQMLDDKRQNNLRV